jgi:hypothetical protein
MKTPRFLYVGPSPLSSELLIAWSPSLKDLMDLCREKIGLDPKFILLESFPVGRCWRKVRHVILTPFELDLARQHGAIELTKAGMSNVINAAYEDIPHYTPDEKLTSAQTKLYKELTQLF